VGEFEKSKIASALLGFGPFRLNSPNLENLVGVWPFPISVESCFRWFQPIPKLTNEKLLS